MPEPSRLLRLARRLRTLAWRLRLLRFCFHCDRWTVLRHDHHDVHGLDGWWTR